MAYQGGDSADGRETRNAMAKNIPLARSLLALVLTGAFSPVIGDEAKLCPDEKGPCCDLDWTGQGATIVKKLGDVMVSNSPYVNASIGMRVINGGRVMTLERSTAVVAYDDGCWHEVKENTVLTIEDVSPCCAAAVVPPPPPPPPPVAPNLVWVAPAALVVGAIIKDVNDDDDDDGFIPPPPISR